MLRRVMQFVWEKQWDGREEGERGRETWREGGRGDERERERERGISSPGSRIPDKPVFIALATITIKLWRTIVE